MKISFVIPLHNEEKNTSPLLDRVIKYGKEKKWDFEIIPVDDKSNDKTAEILRKFSRKYKFIRPIFRINIKEEKGNTMGKALIEGTKHSRGDIIIWTMGDLTDDPETYGKIVDKLKDNYDIVFGSRYMPGGSRGNLDLLKAFLSSWGTILARIFFQVPVHDITNAFRGFKKSLFNAVELESSGFSISPEFAVKAHMAGFKLCEVPTEYTNRVEGVSSFRLFQMTRSYLKLYFSLFWKYKILRKPYDFVI